MSSSTYAPCAACKFLRRKCTQECVFAPYFPPENPQKFANVHKVFGASNVGKLLNELNPNQRIDAVNSLAYEAACRIKDPIYGCVGHVAYMQHHLRQIHEQTELAKKELATYIGPSAMLPILNPNHPAVLQQQQNFDPTAQQAAMYHALQMGGPPGGQSNDEFEDAGNPVTATGFIQMSTPAVGGSFDTRAYQLIQQQHARAQEHLLQQQQNVTADHHHRHLQHELDQRQASHSQQQTLRDSSEDDMPCVINVRPPTNTFSE
ncbi:hypothetical protein DH2020_012334 [Rehmannia glutinosa]|uniref:LOB domain-containing protein n=1 Tax=Rehmannia glutinosa TaxID=99300 RepID=A0ABR0X2L1_REHGL